MPELPEVEVIRKSLHKKIKQKKIKKVIVRNRNLRFKIPSNFSKLLKNHLKPSNLEGCFYLLEMHQAW